MSESAIRHKRGRRGLIRIHVNQHIIRRNARTGATDPPLTVLRGRQRERADRVLIEGPSEVVYRPTHPLSCGARVWIETTAPVRVGRNP